MRTIPFRFDPCFKTVAKQRKARTINNLELLTPQGLSRRRQWLSSSPTPTRPAPRFARTHPLTTPSSNLW